jgi:adenylylsulfate kinase
MKRDTHYRSFLKGVSYRCLAILVSVSIVYYFTKSYAIAFSVAVIEIIAKVLLFYFHERVWESISFGKKR